MSVQISGINNQADDLVVEAPEPLDSQSLPVVGIINPEFVTSTIAEIIGNDIKLPGELVRALTADVSAYIQNGASSEKDAVLATFNSYLVVPAPLSSPNWICEEEGESFAVTIDCTYFDDSISDTTRGDSELQAAAKMLATISSSTIDIEHHELRSTSSPSGGIAYVALVSVKKELIAGESDSRCGIAIANHPIKALLQALVNGFNRHFSDYEE